MASIAFNSKLIFFCFLFIYFIGTYHDLLIESNVVEIDGDTGTIPKIEKKRRRRKRKCALQKSSSSANISPQIGRRSSEYLPSLLDSGKSESEKSVPTRCASSAELDKMWDVLNGAATEEEDGLVPQHDEVLSVIPNGSSCASSALETESPSAKEISDLSQEAGFKGVIFKTVEKSHETIPIFRQGNGSVSSAGLSSEVQCLSSPFFIKTAMYARSSRIGNSLEPSPQARLKSDNWEWYSGHRVTSKSSQGSLSPTSSSNTLHKGSEHSANGHF